MLISGTGITSFTAKIKPDFQPETVYSLQWFQTSKGNWHATDRGVTADQYDVDLRVYGQEHVINDFAVQIDANRTAGSNIVTLSGFNSQEHIFGADLNYTGSINATIHMQRGAQKTWKGFEQPFRVSCLSPSFVASVGSLPPLRFVNIGYDGDSDRTVNKYDTYNRTFHYEDHAADFGTFTGTFIFTDEEMIELRRYIAIQRSATISIPNISGVDKPYGWRSGTYPLSVKIISFTDMGMYSVTNGKPRWVAKLVLAEVIT